MSISIRYFISGANADLLDLRTPGSEYTLTGQQVIATGSATANTVRAALGVELDARNLLGGEDVVVFNYRWDQYSKSLTTVSGAIVFTHTDAATGLTEKVTVLNGSTALGRDKLIFADGAVLTQNARTALVADSNAPISSVPSVDLGTTSGTYVPPTPAGNTLRAFGSTDSTTSGSTFAMAEAGQTLIATGSSQADKVYVKVGATVDARNLLGGEDTIYFTGQWADYTKSLTAVSGAIRFTRTVEVNGQSYTESVTVLNGATSLGRDKLVFADGAVLTQNARSALTGDLNVAITAVTGYDVNTGTPFLKDIQSINVTNDVRASGYYKASETITFAVDFKEAVTVTGVPRLKVIVGNTEREINYTGSANSGKRLLFQYQVLATDSDFDGVSIPNGASAFVLGSGVTIKYANNADAPLDHDPVRGLVRAKIDNNPAPNAPSIAQITDNEGGNPTTIPPGGSSNDATPTVRVSLNGTNAMVAHRVQLYDNQVAVGAAVWLTQENINAGYVDITTASLSEGTHSFTAQVVSATDLASGLSTAAYSITLDLTAPAVSITSVTDDTAPQTGTVLSGGYSNDTQLTVRVNLSHVGVKVGDTLQLFNGSTVISATVAVSATDKNNGYLDINTYALSNGHTYDIHVRATDAAGNGNDSAAHTITIDTVAPDASSVLGLQADTGSSVTDLITRNGTVLLIGLEVGASIQYSTDGGISWTSHVQANNATTGHFTLASGSYTASDVWVRQVDAAGNVGVSASFPHSTFQLQRLRGVSGAYSDESVSQAAMADGGSVVAWAGMTSDGRGYDVFVQRYDARNVATGPLQRLEGASSGSNNADWSPRVVALSDGSYVVTWQGQTADNQGVDIFAQRFAANNTKSGSVQRLQGMSGALDDTAVQSVALAGGNHALVWSGRSSDSQGADVFVRVIGSDNTPIGALQRLRGTSGNFTDDQAQIVALTGGGFVVTWRSYKSFGTWDRDVLVQRFDALGNPLQAAYRLGDIDYYNEDDAPQVAALADGGYVVVWQGYLPGVSANTFAQRFDATGGVVGSQHNWQGIAGSYDDLAPQVAALSGGGYVVAWYAMTSDGQGYDVFVQRVDAGNQTASGIQRLRGATGDLGDQNVVVKALTGGGYVMAWQGEISDGQGTDIFVQQYGSGGQVVGQMHRLQGSAGGYADTAPQLSALADGGYLVTWSGGTADGQSTDIFTQRFDAQGNTSRSVTVDSTAPVLVGAVVNGDVLTLTYDSPLDAAALPDASLFTVLAGGLSVSVGSLSALGNNLTLSLAERVGHGYPVTVTYTDPSAGDDANTLQDVAGNDALSLSGVVVTNLTPLIAPVLKLQADTGTSASDGITNNGTILVSGLAYAASWQYSTDGGATWTAGTGNRFTLATRGTAYDVRVKQTVGATSTNATEAWSVTVDSTAPISTIVGFDKYGASSDGIRNSDLTDTVGTMMTGLSSSYSALLEGTSEAYARVTFDIGGQSKTVSADAYGYWSYRLTSDDFANVGFGAETITVTSATDRAGNTSTAAVTRNVTFNAVADTMSHAESGWGSDYVDALVYGGAGWKGSIVTYSFAPGADGVPDWTATEKAAMVKAFQSYENVCNLRFIEGKYSTDDYQTTSIELNKVPGNTWSEPGVLADFNLPTDRFNVYYGAVQGRFDYQETAWANMDPGSLGYYVLIHELGHGLGLAHPFDDSPKFPGVWSANDKGTYNLNQGIWTVMSYHFDWDNSPADTSSAYAWGYAKTPMTFDVAAMQAMYGVNATYKAGNDTYSLPTVETRGTGWECIWDAGGIDTISNAGASSDCIINLNAYPKTGGEESELYVSYNRGNQIAGGFTIADGAIIENAIGGNGADILAGNGVANQLTGNGGADLFAFVNDLGGGNIDTLTDFSQSQGDKFGLYKAIFTAFSSMGSVSDSMLRVGAGVTTATDNDDFLIYNTSSGAVYYDQDGSGSSYNAVQWGFMQNKPAVLRATDFVLF